MINSKDKDLFILLGPTGVGKTDISIKLVQKMPDIEIISADSMQIYKYMDIGFSCGIFQNILRTCFS
ncbi:unnamed protein product [marine sediment metagenome]|uniref:Uncharacterized protein n=1 Tax=marine sediment metagenome TaxID=412755 RepID=X1RSJ2_9ZZZZ